MQLSCNCHEFTATLDSLYVSVIIGPSVVVRQLVLCTVLKLTWHQHSSLCGSNCSATKRFAGDFPDVGRYREILQAYDITTFPKLKESMLKAIEDSLSVDIPSLVRQFDNPYA